MSFKDIIAEDVHRTFMNPEEFSDIHNLNGVTHSITSLFLHNFFYAFIAVATFLPLYLVQKAHPVPVPDSFIVTSFAATLPVSFTSYYF